MNDHLRPDFHFTAPASWINDPNGLVFADGEYHLFYQCNPAGPAWGNMSWGHAVSTDLVTWEHLPVALAPYPTAVEGRTTMIFSGSAIADDTDVLGLGRPCGRTPLAAFYTAHEREGETPISETQCLATSVDGGRTWERFTGNPVLDRGRRDFRDPKVFRDHRRQRFVMVVAAASLRCIELYHSIDLVEWTLASTFGQGSADEPVWECPDLFEVPIDGADRATAWVLCYSSGHPQGAPFSGMKYVVGEFDGTEFVPLRTGTPLAFEHGKDFFAGVTYSGLAPGTPPVMIGWASNWAYAGATPTGNWRGVMSAARRLTLRRADDMLLLAQEPMSQSRCPVTRLTIDRCGDSRLAGLRLGTDDAAEFVEVGYDRELREWYVDRRRAGSTTFSPHFASRDSAPARDRSTMMADVYFDRSIVEVFADGGTTVLTELAFPTGPWSPRSFGDGVLLR